MKNSLQPVADIHQRANRLRVDGGERLRPVIIWQWTKTAAHNSDLPHAVYAKQQNNE